MSETDTIRFTQLCLDRLWAGALMFERASELGRPKHARATADWVQSMIGRPGNETCWNSAKAAFQDWGYDEFVSAVEASEEAALAAEDQMTS